MSSSKFSNMLLSLFLLDNFLSRPLPSSAICCFLEDCGSVAWKVSGKNRRVNKMYTNYLSWELCVFSNFASKLNCSLMMISLFLTHFIIKHNLHGSVWLRMRYPGNVGCYKRANSGQNEMQTGGAHGHAPGNKEQKVGKNGRKCGDGQLVRDPC